MPRPLMLLDTASLYFRAFYGVPDLRKDLAEPPTNAVRGLLDMIARLVTEYRPQAVVPCWDDDWRPGFRVDLLPSYKEHRVADGDDEEVPDDLSPQVPVIREVLTALGLPPVGVPGYEADDVMASYASQHDGPVDVVTGDRDLFQLVDDTRPIRVLYTARGISKLQIVDGIHVAETYGVRPDQYADFAVLRGDPSDGLPGVPGIGAKTAARLLTEFGELAGVRAAAAEPSSLTPRIRTSLLDSADYLDRAPAVVRTVRTLELPDAPRALPKAAIDPQALERLSEEFALRSSVGRLLTAMSAD